jgi:hypothetical protein
MIFEAEAEQISRLSSTDLVQLMKLLLLAEARLAEIPLRAATVAMQITVADGGEDGRVEWAGGATSTDYFPSMFCLFQAKAQNVTQGSLRSEILKRPRVEAHSGKKPKKANKTAKAKSARTKPTLSRALQEVLSRGGSYIVFTSKPLGPEKIPKLQNAIRDGIREAGKNPDRLAAIGIYDANKIADWVNSHPSVALWLASHERRRSLAGFQTHESWGKSPETRTGPWIDGDKARFTGVNVTPPEGQQKGPESRTWTFSEAADEFSQRLANEGQCIRIAGPSGFGKSRFVYEVFGRTRTIADQVDRVSVIYADHSIVGDEIPKLALEIADSGFACILVVDECPDQVHVKLASIAQRVGSKLRLVTLDVETTVVQAKDTLTIRLEPAPKEMISQIARGVTPKLSDADTQFIQELSHGFPQMAVMAAQQNARGREAIQSVEQLLHRIIWGRRAQNSDAQKALETLSLFDWVAIAGRHADQVKLVARELTGMSEDTFIEAIKSFKSRGIVIHRGSFVQVQPIPLAARLAARRWNVLPDGKMVAFFQAAPPELKESILRRIRWLDNEPEAGKFAAALLAPTAFGSLEALNTDFGSKVLDRLVHVQPDLAISTLTRVFGTLSIAELRAIEDGRRHLVWALERLAFRHQSFIAAATLLRKFGAAETEGRISNNASGQFKQLYQLHLSGTQAPPADRLIVLDEGLASKDEQERVVGFAALEQMLDTGHFSRGGGAEEIGTRTLEDWQPKTYGEIWAFYREAIKRLLTIALDDADPLKGKAKASFGSNIRGLLRGVPFEDVEAFIKAITGRYGFWPDAVQELNEWLFFDRQGVPPEFAQKVRGLFDELMPVDPVELAVLYTHGWHADFHDPDVGYDREAKSDFEYAMRQSVAQAVPIVGDPVLLDRALTRFATGDAKTPFAFARRLAELAVDAFILFASAIAKAEAVSAPANIQFFSGLIAGADSRDSEIARRCVRAALQSEKLKTNAIAMIGANKLQPADLELVASLLRSGDIEPWQCAPLSYGRGFDHLNSAEIMPLLDELSNHGAPGLWTILEMVSLYLHGGRVPDRSLLRKLKDVLLDPQLLTRANRRNRDGYTFEHMIDLLSRHNAINASFARALTKQALSICYQKDHDLFFELDDPVRKVLTALIVRYPHEVWAEVSRPLLCKDWMVRHRIEQLVEFGHDNNLGSGVLNALPAGLYIEWVRQNPKKRASIVMHWLPIADKSADGSLSWNPALESFITEFGGQDHVLAQLAMRLHPRSWWGSIGPHLEPLIPLLDKWFSHPSAAVRQWARDYQERIKATIAEAAQRSEEDVVRFG